MEMMKTSGDIEAGNKLLYRRHLYLEQALIWLLAVAIGTVVVLVPAIPKFLLTTTPGIVVYILALVAPFAGVLLTIILMSVVYVTLILYTFWAAARGHDFGFMGPFLMVSLFVLIVFALIQIFIPFGITIYSPLMTIVFSGFLIKCCGPSPQRCEPLPGMLGKCGGQ